MDVDMGARQFLFRMNHQVSSKNGILPNDAVPAKLCVVGKGVHVSKCSTSWKEMQNDFGVRFGWKMGLEWKIGTGLAVLDAPASGLDSLIEENHPPNRDVLISSRKIISVTSVFSLAKATNYNYQNDPWKPCELRRNTRFPIGV